MAGLYIEIIQGDSYIFQTNVAVDGVPQDLTGATLWFLAKGDPDFDDDDNAVIAANSNSGQLVVSNGANSNVNSVVTMTLNTNVTQNYSQANSLFWMIRAKLTNGQKYTLDRGRACVSISLFNATS